MKRSSAVHSLIALVAMPAVCLAGEGVFMSTMDDGSTIARNASGAVLWQNYNINSGTATRAARPPGNNTSAGPAWDDPPTVLDSSLTGSFIAGPIFDSFGNAWVVINDPVNLLAIQSVGTSGTWQAPHIIGSSLPTGAGTVGLSVDQAGGFYVTYGTYATAGDTSNPLMWTKYTPAAGWLTPALIYNSPTYFTETFPSIDSAGRLVVVFNANGISSIASNPSQTSWGAVQTISPATADPILPSVAANKSGTRLALVYLLTGRGLSYTFFNSTTGQWNRSALVPGSQLATFTAYGTENAFPIAVDESGNVTLASSILAKARNADDDSATARPTLKYTIGGFRYEGGQWTTQQLLAPSASSPATDQFGSIALNASGVVLISVPTWDGSTGVNISLFRYTPGQGWDTEIAAHYNSTTGSRCSVAWFESTEAVVVYADHALPASLAAALYSNGSWGSAPAIPGNFPDVAAPKLAGAPSGEALLGVPYTAVYATFLRP